MIKFSDEMKVALIRGVASAASAGALSFFTVWGTGEDHVRTLVAAGVTPTIATIIIRFGLEGAYDTVKANRQAIVPAPAP